jgi:hypothetical protein
VVFTAPTSANGCWAQLAMLEEAGFKAPAGLEHYHFEGSPSDGTRVVFSVIYGTYRLGACRVADLTRLTEERMLRRGEIHVIRKADPVPELVIAAAPGQAGYYRRKLRNIQDMLDEHAVPAMQDDTVKLLKSFGIRRLRPIDDEGIERAEQLRALAARVLLEGVSE